MTMRGLIWFVLLFVAAAALAIIGVFDGGQVLLVMPPYRVDVSLNLFVVAFSQLVFANIRKLITCSGKKA